jgi:hypothetical protein
MHKHKQESADYSIEETHSVCLKDAALGGRIGKSGGQKHLGLRGSAVMLKEAFSLSM